MRFVTYADDDGDRVGVLHHDQVHPLGRGVTMLGLLRDGTLRAAGSRPWRRPPRPGRSATFGCARRSPILPLCGTS